VEKKHLQDEAYSSDRGSPRKRYSSLNSKDQKFNEEMQSISLMDASHVNVEEIVIDGNKLRKQGGSTEFGKCSK
jgi:hypothetical protein